ncbi:MAG TPA: hypothetical protein VIE66_03565, partial [Methylocella sp.]
FAQSRRRLMLVDRTEHPEPARRPPLPPMIWAIALVLSCRFYDLKFGDEGNEYKILFDGEH